MMRNLILIVLDTARADGFTPYGAAGEATPAIADIARRGVAARKVIAPSNWTLPSHASMFTGILPGPLGLTGGTKIGSRTGLNSRPILESRGDRVLASVLRDRGFATAAISANPWIHEIHGFGTGFERFVSLRGGNRKHPAGGIRSRIAWAVDALRARADDGARETRTILERWLSERDGRRFFWFVNLMECHSPYLPPKPYNDLSGIERVRAARDAERYQTPEGIYRVCVGEVAIHQDAQARMRHLYARSIRQMDDWIAWLLGELDRVGILDETLVAVVSDHGENLGESGLIGHELSMDDRLISVPMVFSTAVDVPPLASLAHLPSIVAGSLALGEHPWRDDPLIRGFAVSQVAGQVLLPEREALARGWGVPDEAIRRIADPMTCATDGRYKLVRDGEGERLYDLETDPAETAPLPPHGDGFPSALAGSLRSAIDDVDAMVPTVADATPGGGNESAELEERLRALGYI
jgi:arylsulfatase A-like enzyme